MRCILAAAVSFFAATVHSQQLNESAWVQGSVHNSQGKLVAGATLHLQAQNAAQSETTRSDSQGKYRFAGLQAGVYVLRAEMQEYRDTEIPAIFLGPTEGKTVDLVLQPVKGPPPSSAGAQAPQFFDEPKFAVAGVTDTTGLGGHGSDTVVRTRETLANETLSLSKEPAPVPPNAALEKEKGLRDRAARDPGSFEANHLLGKVLDENGKSREAIPYLEKAAKINSADDENSYDLALASFHAGEYERSRSQARALIVHHDNAEVHHLLGDVEEKLGNALEAVREYQVAAESDPREPYVFDWGAELLLHHAPEPAIEVFTRGNLKYPNSARMLMGLGAAWFARGSYDQAVQRICLASDLNPRDPMPYVFLGKMQAAESAPSGEAVEKLHRFASQQPQNAYANYYYAVGIWKLRKGLDPAAGVEQVESFLDTAIRLDPKFAAAYLQRGIMHAEQKNILQAISDYQHAIQADPQLEEAHYRLAHAYRLNGETSRSDAELKIYDRIAKESAQKSERERHEIRQFVYTLRDQHPAPVR